MKKTLDLLLTTATACVAIAVLAASTLDRTASIKIWYGITSLGSEELYVALSILVYYLVSPWLGFTAAVAVLLGGALVVDLKNIFMLPRPPDPLYPVEGYGFPSGHSQVSSAFWSSMILATKKWSVAVLGVALVSSISISRIALNAHYPRDVLGGVFFGSLVGGFLAFIAYKIPSSRQLAIYTPAIPLSVGVFSLISYVYISSDITLLRIAGTSIGLSIHPFIYKNPRQVHRRSMVERLAIAAALGVTSASIIYATRGATPLIEITGYLTIGLLIPLAGYILDTIERYRKG